MSARWYFEDSPSANAVVIRLHWENGLPAATLLPPEGFAGIADVDAISGTSMPVPAAFGAAVFLSLREKVRLRVTGDRSAWESGWGVLQDAPGKWNN